MHFSFVFPTSMWITYPHFAQPSKITSWGIRIAIEKTKGERQFQYSDFYRNRNFRDHWNMIVTEITKTEKRNSVFRFLHHNTDFLPGSLWRAGVVRQLCGALQGERHTSRLGGQPGKGIGGDEWTSQFRTPSLELRCGYLNPHWTGGFRQS